MAEKETFQQGAVVFPLVSPASRSALRDADPALYFTLDFLSFAITKYMGARFIEEATAAQVGLVAGAVGVTVSYDPAPFLASTQFRFPLLAMYRRDKAHRDRSAAYRSGKVICDVVYVLPPLTAGQMMNLVPLLNAVDGIVDHAIEQGFDPTYTPPGGNAGDSMREAAFANLESIEVKTSTHVSFPGAQGDLYFPAIAFEVELAERASVGDVPGAFPNLTGTDIVAAVDPGEKGGPVLDVSADLVNFDLAISAISPGVGPVAGNTTLNIGGTGFTPDVHVVIGGKLAKNIVVVGTTMITCKTPPYDAPPTSVDVTVTNRLNQSATREDGFTYV